MKDYLRRNIWILSELYQNPKGLTYKEFAERWEQSSQNILGTSLPKRTFADCLRAIEETFDIDISSDARNGYRYRIVQRDWLEKDSVKDWVLSAFAMNGLLQDCKGLRDRVMCEDVPSGNEHLMRLLDAMKENRIVELTYKDYYDESSLQLELCPYLVRLFRQRWYVVGKVYEAAIRRFSLDRILYLEVSDKCFKLPRDFSADAYFEGAFGIIVEPEEYDVETIRLKAYDINHRREYLRSLPLHHSQREIEQAVDYSIFELRLAPTYDFIQAILAMGSEVEVLAPEYVRQEIKWRITEMHQRYV